MCWWLLVRRCRKILITYDKIVDKVSSELYISHIIYQQLLDGVTFKAQKVERYSDWGTLEDWNKYKSEYKTIFTDLDGVLVENSAEYFEPHGEQQTPAKKTLII